MRRRHCTSYACCDVANLALYTPSARRARLSVRGARKGEGRIDGRALEDARTPALALGEVEVLDMLHAMERSAPGG